MAETVDAKLVGLTRCWRPAGDHLHGALPVFPRHVLGPVGASHAVCKQTKHMSGSLREGGRDLVWANEGKAT